MYRRCTAFLLTRRLVSYRMQSALLKKQLRQKRD